MLIIIDTFGSYNSDREAFSKIKKVFQQLTTSSSKNMPHTLASIGFPVDCSVYDTIHATQRNGKLTLSLQRNSSNQQTTTTTQIVDACNAVLTWVLNDFLPKDIRLQSGIAVRVGDYVDSNRNGYEEHKKGYWHV